MLLFSILLFITLVILSDFYCIHGIGYTSGWGGIWSIVEGDLICGLLEFATLYVPFSIGSGITYYSFFTTLSFVIVMRLSQLCIWYLYKKRVGERSYNPSNTDIFLLYQVKLIISMLTGVSILWNL